MKERIVKYLVEVEGFEHSELESMDDDELIELYANHWMLYGYSKRVLEEQLGE